MPVPDYTLETWESGHLTGDWAGARTSIADGGVTFDLSLTQFGQGVVDGGRDRGWRYGGKLDAVIDFDLQRMDVLPGAIVSLHAESRYGRSVNEAAGTLLPVTDKLFFPITSELDEDVAIAITELRYTQFLSKEVGLFLGKFVPLGGDLNEFAGGRGDTQFLSHPFLSASVTALINPYSTLGGGIFVTPVENLFIQLNLYQTADSSTTTGFENFGDGWTTDTSVRYQYRLGELPGGFRAAFEYAFDGSFIEFNDRYVDPDGALRFSSRSDTWNAYANLWQYLHVEEATDKPINVADGRTDLQGFGVFARAGFADRRVNPIDWVVSGGIAGKGVLPGRDHDTFGIAYVYTEVSDEPFLTDRVLSSSTQRFEAYYNLAITPAAELTFDLQWADSEFARQDEALVVGARLRLQF